MGRFLGDYASDIYGTKGSGVNTFIPRNKFQFLAEIEFLELSSSGNSEFPSFKNSTITLDRIASIDMPGHSAKTNVLNQYNKKRIIQTGVEYTPVNLTAYDTRDALIEKFLSAYHSYYFKGTYSSHDDKKYIDDVLAETFISDINSGGFSNAGLQAVPYRNFIKTIIITRRSSDENISVTKIHNPMISSVTVDTLDYSDSSPVQYRIEFQYEGYQTVEYKANDTPKNKSASNTPGPVPQKGPQKGPTQQIVEQNAEYSATAFAVGESNLTQAGLSNSLAPGEVTTGNTRFEEEVLRNGLDGAL